MADLRIVDAPLLSTVKGTEKLPTGGEGNFSVSVNQVADFAKLKWFLATEGYVDTAVNGVRSELVTHVNAINNPHQVTKAQVGLGNVDNTADLDKPVSNATQSAINTLSQNKADKSTTYSKTESDSLLANKSDTSYLNTKYSSHIKTFLNTGTALANTVDGEYFFVISSDSEKVEDLYLNVNGVSTNQNKSELSSSLQHNSILGRDTTGAHQATSIGTASGVNQQEINDFGGAKWYNKSGGYKLGATVKLENGDTVKSTVANNSTNPNINMTGWFLPYMRGSQNLVELTNKATSRSNLDVYSKGEALAKDNNLSELSDKAVARTNLDVYSKAETNTAISNVATPNATETTAGKAKIATTAIAQAGVNDTDILTAKKLRDALNAEGGAPISACRAWADISGGTSPSIRAESNILSVVRTGVGNYTITFKTPMSRSNYIVFFGGSRGGSSGLVGSIQSRTSSSFVLRTWSPTDPSDWSDIFIGVFG